MIKNLAIAIILFPVFICAQASTVVIEGGAPGSEQAIFSQDGYYVDSAATIVPIAKSVSFNQLKWWGSYSNYAPQYDDFSFSIYSYGGSDLIFSKDFIAVNRIFDGIFYQYSVDLDLINIGPGTYEFEIQHLGLSYNGPDPLNQTLNPLGTDWVWYFSKDEGPQAGVIANFFDGTRMELYGYTDSLGEISNGGLAFQAILNPNFVPEPETFVLVLLGMVILGVSSLRRRSAFNIKF
jgi:hypothetical protein